MPEKFCRHCGKILVPTVNMGPKTFALRVYCDDICHQAYRKVQAEIKKTLPKLKKSKVLREMRKPRPIVKDVKKLRECLSCGAKFMSRGPGNRICPKCKGTHNWVDGETTFAGGLGERNHTQPSRNW